MRRSIFILAFLFTCRLFAEKPNIIFILTDDLGYGDVSCYNPNSKITTPYMDSLAREGMRFTSGHSNDAQCTPTRYGTLSGRYCWRTWMKSGVLAGHDTTLIEHGRMTVASMLKQNGYRTGIVGKWHLGLDWTKLNTGTAIGTGGTNINFSKPVRYGPREYGFDYSYVIPASLDMSPYVWVRNDTIENPNVTWTTPNSEWLGQTGYASNDFKFEEALPKIYQKSREFILDHATGSPGTPFYLHVTTTSPHHPILPSPEFQGKSAAKLAPYGSNYLYGDFVMQTDWVIGRIVRLVDSLNLGPSTLIIVTSDNGPETVTCALQASPVSHFSNRDLRGYKRDIWEGGVRVPFIVRWSGKVPAGTVTDEPVCHTDFMATVAAIICYQLSPNAGEDSYSILPLLLGKTYTAPIKNATVVHSSKIGLAIISGKWKYIPGVGSNGGQSYPLTDISKQGININGCGAQYSYGTTPARQLYDLEKSPRELNAENIYPDSPAVWKRLDTILGKIQADGRSAPNPRNDACMSDLVSVAHHTARRLTCGVPAFTGLKVYDLRGRLVASGQGGRPPAVRHLRPGIYLVMSVSPGAPAVHLIFSGRRSDRK